MTSRKAVLSLAVLLIATTPLALAQARGTYTTIDYPGANATFAAGINAASDIVGTFTDANNFEHGFLLSGGVYTQLDVPGFSGTSAYGINDVGLVVGGLPNNIGLWVYDTQTQTYAVYPYSGGGDFVNITGVAVNNAGFIVGWAQEGSTGQYIGLELKNSTFKKVRIPGGYSTQLTGINNFGSIIAVTTSVSAVRRSYLSQSGGTFKQIVVTGVPSAVAVAINDSNVLTGDYVAPAHDSAFEWERMGLFKPINEPQETNTFANGINIAGQVVGYYYDSSFHAHGFTWTPPADAAKK